MSTWFGRRICQTQRVVDGWLNIRWLIWNYHRFVCHNCFLAHDYWCGVGGSEMDKITSRYFYPFSPLLLAEFGWNLLPLQLVKATLYWGERKKVPQKKVTQGFQQQSFRLVVQRVWMVQRYWWGKVIRYTLGVEVPTLWIIMDFQKDVVWLKTKNHTWMMRLGKNWSDWHPLLFN